jgi:putative hydrolase of the HAD superfamily
MTPPVRAVISDFGGVLTTPLIEAFTAYQDHTGLSPGDVGRAIHASYERTGVHPLYELERGTISEADFVSRVEAELDPPARLESFSEIWFEALHPNERLIAWLRGVRARGFRTALLTNNVREWEPLWRAKLPEIDEIFEVVVDSAFVGVRKPEPEIYVLTVELLGAGLTPADCAFLDDLEVNVEAARSLGMQAVHFRDTDQAIAELEALLGPR